MAYWNQQQMLAMTAVEATALLIKVIEHVCAAGIRHALQTFSMVQQRNQITSRAFLWRMHR